MALTLKVLAAGQLSGTDDTAIYPAGAALQTGKSALVANVVIANRGSNPVPVPVELTVRKQNATIGITGRGAYIYKGSLAAGAVEPVNREVSLLLNTGPDAMYLKGATDIEYIVNGLERDL